MDTPTGVLASDPSKALSSSVSTKQPTPSQPRSDDANKPVAPSGSMVDRASSPLPKTTPRPTDPNPNAIQDKAKLLAVAAALVPHEPLPKVPPSASGSKLAGSNADKDDEKRKSNFLSKITHGSVRLMMTPERDDDKKKRDDKERELLRQREKEREKERREKEKRERRPESLGSTVGGAVGGAFASLRGGKRQPRDDLVISRPYSFVVKTHVDDQLRWQGEDPVVAFTLEQRIGGGAYGAVYRAVHKSSGYVFAIKCVTLTKTELQELQKEIEILKRCKDINIVQYYGSYLKEDTLWILMDYCQVGSLLDLLRLIKRTLTEEEIGAIMYPVLRGLFYLHNENIIHRDLKSANILLNEHMQPRIADFGVSAQIGNMLTKAKSVVGTPLFMSPEVLDGAQYDTKADIWSLGITAIECADGYPPYHQENIMRAIMLIVQSPPPTMRESHRWSENFKAFVALCCAKSAPTRPSAEQLLNHPFILAVASAPPAHKPLAHLAEDHRRAKEKEREERERERETADAAPASPPLAAAVLAAELQFDPRQRRSSSVDEQQLSWDQRAVGTALLPTERLTPGQSNDSSRGSPRDENAELPEEREERVGASKLVPVERLAESVESPRGAESSAPSAAAATETVDEALAGSVLAESVSTAAVATAIVAVAVNLTASDSSGESPPTQSLSLSSSSLSSQQQQQQQPSASGLAPESGSALLRPTLKPSGGRTNNFAELTSTREGSSLRSISQPSLKRGSTLLPAVPAATTPAVANPPLTKRTSVMNNSVGSHVVDPATQNSPSAQEQQALRDRVRQLEERNEALQQTVNRLKEQLIIERADNASSADELKMALTAMADWKASVTRVEQNLKEHADARHSRRKNAEKE